MTKYFSGEREFSCFSHSQCGKMRNLVSPKKYSVKLTTYLVISLVKTLLSRNFCHKCVRLNRSNFHTVTLLLFPLFLAKISWKRRYTKELFWRNTFWARVNSLTFHTMLWKFRNFTATILAQKIRQISFFLLKSFTLDKLTWRKQFRGRQRIFSFSTQ